MVFANKSSLVTYILVVAALQVSQVSTQAGPSHSNSICLQIANAVSNNTNVYFPGEPNYKRDIAHYAGSSAQESLCSVEPGNPTDVGKILKLVGQTRTPFAVKSGGHIMNPGFSSTEGVHISMTRFSEVTYDSKSQTAVVGAGLIWDDVYAALEPHNVSVGGGRASGIGVGGFALGGGYSWHANQHGLTIDMITAFELVKPTGQVTTVTEASDSDLFFGLKGGFNNFGIVTRFTFRAFPQGPVWGGITFYNSSQVAAVLDATVRFSESNTDPKANIIASVDYVPGFLQAPFASLVMFYDSPKPPSGVFDQFLSIPALQSNVSTRSLLSLIQSVGSGAPPVRRGVYGAAPIRHNSHNVANAVLNEIHTLSTKLAQKSVTEILCAFEPFLPTVLSHNNLSTAYPHSRDTVYLPMNIWFQWNDTKDDAVMTSAARQTTNNILEAAKRDGQDLRKASAYPNYAIWGTKLEDMYGGNVPKLRSLKRRVDPKNIMGLAGGWKF